MTVLDICLCILTVAGAFALICLGVFFVRALSTIDALNSRLNDLSKTIDAANQTIEGANQTIEDVNYKLGLMNAPIEKINGLFGPSKSSGMMAKSASILGAYRAGKKRRK